MKNTVAILILLWLAIGLAFRLGFIAGRPDNLYLFNQQKMNFLADGNWSHDLPDCDYSCQANRSGLNGLLGENLYYGQTCDILTIVDMWQNSPPHKKVLDQGYDEGVISIRRTGEHCYAVMNVITK